MTISQRLSLLWRRFSPLEEQLIVVVREVLPPQAQTIFDAQVGGITLVQRRSHLGTATGRSLRAKAPNKCLTRMESSPWGVLLDGFDGTTA